MTASYSVLHLSCVYPLCLLRWRLTLVIYEFSWFMEADLRWWNSQERGTVFYRLRLFNIENSLHTEECSCAMRSRLLLVFPVVKQSDDITMNTIYPSCIISCILAACYQCLHAITLPEWISHCQANSSSEFRWYCSHLLAVLSKWAPDLCKVKCKWLSLNTTDRFIHVQQVVLKGLF